VGGNRVQLVVKETEPYSDAAREAREKFGITAVPVPEVGGSQANVRRVFLGLAFTCGAEEDVIPFFERGLPVIDLRLLCREPVDYANPIEPSSVGGAKIAQAIVAAVTSGRGEPRRTRVFAG